MKKVTFTITFLFMIFIEPLFSVRVFTKEHLNKLKDEAKEMFYHGYNSYLKYAYPYDELRPLSCDGFDTYGSYSLTLIDALDTLAIMGNKSEFQRVVDILLTSKKDFDADINVSVFETNIRIVGGLLSAHLLSHKAGIKLEPGWPCNGPLLRLAEDVAKRLIVAFDTKTGMPYGTVNLRKGIPKGETTVTCTAGIGTFIVEFGTLSRLTGDPLYEEVALNALYSLFNHKSPIGLFGNHIDIENGQWTAQDAGIGSGVDSYFEYLVKGSILLQKPELMEMFKEARRSIDKYLKKDDWYMWATMTRGMISLPVFQSLDAFWPGVLSLIGDTTNAMRTLHNYHQVWQQYGFLPEFYYIGQTEAGSGKEVYPLRPEHIESIMLLYRATGDPFLLQAGEDILRSLQHSARTPCGYATIKDVKSHRKEDRMESFFLAETTKYLYLLFDTDNFMHNQGQHGTLINTPHGECIIDAGGYIYNTEAHPIDPSALHCCHSVPTENLYDFTSFEKNKSIYKGLPIKKLQVETVLEVNDEPNEVTTAPLDLKNDSIELSNISSNLTDNKTADFTILTEEDIANYSMKKEENKTAVEPAIQEIPKKPFDPQEMLERLRNSSFLKNQTLANNYNILGCNAQPFLDKLSIMGEFFN